MTGKHKKSEVKPGTTRSGSRRVKNPTQIAPPMGAHKPRGGKERKKKGTGLGELAAPWMERASGLVTGQRLNSQLSSTPPTLLEISIEISLANLIVLHDLKEYIVYATIAQYSKHFPHASDGENSEESEKAFAPPASSFLDRTEAEKLAESSETQGPNVGPVEAWSNLGVLQAEQLAKHTSAEDEPDELVELDSNTKQVEDQVSLSDILATTVRQTHARGDTLSTRDDLALVERYTIWVIGVAHLNFDRCGYSVEHILPFTHDNLIVDSHKLNVRPLDVLHANKMVDALSVLGAKRDYKSPIVIRLAESRIQPECLQSMKDKDWYGIRTSTPELRLKIAPEAIELANLLQLKVDKNSKPVTDDQLAEARTKLEALRSKGDRIWAYLVNGNHRIAGMRGNALKIQKRWDEILQLQEEGTIDRAEFNRIVKEWERDNQRLTYRVIVLHENTPQEILAELAENQEAEAQKGAGHAEALWNLGERYEGSIKRHQEKTPQMFREKAVNISRHEHRLVRDAMGEHIIVSNDDEPRKGKSSSTKSGGPPAALKNKGKARASTEDLVHRVSKDDTIDVVAVETADAKRTGVGGVREGKESFMRLGASAVHLEMIIATRSAYWVYNTMFRTDIIGLMLNRLGGMLTAHCWLSIETLLKISDVPTEKYLPDAQKYLNQHIMNITYAGHQSAIEHWTAPRLRPSNAPPLRNVYTEKVSGIFSTHHKDAGFDGSAANWGDPWSPVQVLKLRTAYINFALELMRGDNVPEPTLLFAVMCALYAMLPIAPKPTIATPSGSHAEAYNSDRPKTVSNYFYPGARLPSAKIYRAFWLHYSKIKLTEINWVMDSLLERTQLIWTACAGPALTTTNRDKQAGNFYRSGYWTHNVLLCLVEATHLGCLEDRLALACHMFDRPETIQAIQDAEKVLSSSEIPRLPDLYTNCAAAKKGAAGYPVIDERARTDPEFMPPATEELREARAALKQYATGETKAKSTSSHQPIYPNLDELLSLHPVLTRLASAEIWKAMPIKRWMAGWSSDKTQQLANALLGWALLFHEYEVHVLPQVLRDHRIRPLLMLAQSIWECRGTLPWFWGRFDSQTLDVKFPMPLQPAHDPNQGSPAPSLSPPSPDSKPPQGAGARTRLQTGSLPQPASQPGSSSHAPTSTPKQRTRPSRSKHSQAHPAIKTTTKPSRTSDPKSKALEAPTEQGEESDRTGTSDNASESGRQDEDRGADSAASLSNNSRSRKIQEGREVTSETPVAESEWPDVRETHTLLRDSLPDQFPGLRLLPVELLHNLEAEVFSSQTESFPGAGGVFDMQAYNMFQTYASKIGAVLDGIEVLRAKLRGELYRTVLGALESFMPDAHVQFTLASHLRRICFVFVMLCARDLQTRFKTIGNDEALAEMARMAHTDGLFKTDILLTRKSTNNEGRQVVTVMLNLLPTFALSNQAAVREHGIIEVGELQPDPDGLALHRFSSSIHLLEGLGPTTTHSDQRGFVAYEAQQSWAIDGSIMSCSKEEGPKFPDSQFSVTEQMRTELAGNVKLHQAAGFQLAIPSHSEKQWTDLDDQSAFSTGQLIRSAPHASRPGLSSKTLKARQELTKKLTAIWKHKSKSAVSSYLQGMAADFQLSFVPLSSDLARAILRPVEPATSSSGTLPVLRATRRVPNFPLPIEQSGTPSPSPSPTALSPRGSRTPEEQFNPPLLPSSPVNLSPLAPRAPKLSADADSDHESERSVNSNDPFEADNLTQKAAAMGTGTFTAVPKRTHRLSIDASEEQPGKSKETEILKHRRKRRKEEEEA
ncbi:hypothetical protein FRC12_009165 [Ceratobasidium sp. 428]|nr:hypothetical protein FRC12_009165 [Ceratobasidium sp. 428]